MTEVGKPDVVPEIEVTPLQDPVPRREPRPVPVEPERVEEPELIPA